MAKAHSRINGLVRCNTSGHIVIACVKISISAHSKRSYFQLKRASLEISCTSFSVPSVILKSCLMITVVTA